MIGPGTIIASRNHSLYNGSFRYGEAKIGNIRIGKGSWIGANCTIVTNSELPSASILGANSLLNKKFKKTNTLYAGNPAKFIKGIQL